MIWIALVLLALSTGIRFKTRFAPGEFGRRVSIISNVGIVLAVLFGLGSAIAVVPAGHAGVAVVFGSVRPRSLSEGLNPVNPFAVVENMTVRTETYTMSAVYNEGKVLGDDSIQALSADGLLMPLDITVAYRLVPADAAVMFRNIGPDYVDKIIRPAARTAVREAIAGFTAQEAYSTRREQLATRMDELLTLRLKALLSQHSEFQGRSGFVIEQVMIRNVQLPAKVKDAIEEKLSAEQQALRMQFVLAKERQEAERKRIEAQGIADFQKIVAQGISEPLLAWKGIEATQQLAHSQNTKIIVIGNPKNGMPLIIPTEQK
jgi:regulator of protease activity HflC (stomatin/prohibitin superfamily)